MGGALLFLACNAGIQESDEKFCELYKRENRDPDEEGKIAADLRDEAHEGEGLLLRNDIHIQTVEVDVDLQAKHNFFQQ
jgi:hypothetical protein